MLAPNNDHPFRRTQSLRRVFGVPLVLAVLSAVGLVSALLGDGVWDALSWLALGLPVLLIGYFCARRKAANAR